MDDLSYVVKFKMAFSKDFEIQKQNTNTEWLKKATYFPRLKKMKSILHNDREEIWNKSEGELAIEMQKNETM